MQVRPFVLDEVILAELPSLDSEAHDVEDQIASVLTAKVFSLPLISHIITLYPTYPPAHPPNSPSARPPVCPFDVFFAP